MKYFRNLSATFYLVAFLFLFSLFFRVIFLDRIPIGIVHDNLNFVLNAKAIFYTGHDVSGTWNPLMFTPIPDEPAQAELPYLIIAPFVGPLPLSLFNAHIFYAVINCLFVILLFLISSKFIGRKAAFVVGIVAALNPWNIFFGRSAYEAPLALFFYFLSFYLLLILKNWKKLYSFIPLLLGFYIYMGFKIIFIPFLTASLIFVWNLGKRKNTRQYIVLFAFGIIMFASFLFTVKSQSTGGRLSELSVLPAKISQLVDFQRRISITTPLSNLFANKAIMGVEQDFNKYIGAYSPSYLFSFNESTPRFTIWNHGYFYYLDVFFLLFGLIALYIRNRKFWSYLVFLLLIAPIPTVISNLPTSYSQRSSLMFPVLFIFVGFGIYQFITLFEKRKYILASSGLILLVYFFLLLNFLNTYLFVNPIYMSEGTAFSARVASKYLDLVNIEGKETIVVMDQPKVLYKDYLFYTNSYNRSTVGLVREAFLSKNYKFGKISFNKCSDIKKLDLKATYIFEPNSECSLFDNQKDILEIAQLSDGGTVYKIINDGVCNKFNLKKYPSAITLHQLKVEELNASSFCETYITKF